VLGISDTMLCNLVARGSVDFIRGAGPAVRCRYYNTAAIVAFMRGNTRLKKKVSGVWLQDAVKAGAQTAYDTMRRTYIIEYGAHDRALSMSYAQHLRVMLRAGVTLPKQFDELVRRIAARPQWCERDVIYKTWLWVRLAQCIEVVRTQEARILEVSEEVATLRALVQSLQQQLDDGREHREAIAAGLVRYDGAGAWRRLFGRLFSAGK
jgi:hypothetical protein